MNDPSQLKPPHQPAVSLLANLIASGDKLRVAAREFDSGSDETREAQVQARSRWLADCRTVLLFSGLVAHFDRMDALIVHSARGSYQIAEIVGLLESARNAIEQGIALPERIRGSAEILSDLLSLAKEALTASSVDAKNVAAVLTAAAFEDTIRRMGELLAGISGRPELSQIMNSLKEKGFLTGAPLTTALSYLKFRNDALHADWEGLDRAVVASCLAFTEGLILKHMS